MNITEGIIAKRIEALERELGELRNSHEVMVRDHQEKTNLFNSMAQQNSIRSHQLTGSIAELKQLLNGSKPPIEKDV